MTAAKRPQIERALDCADPKIRAFLLYGPDESASRELAGRIAGSLGADAERIDFTGAQLKTDPALLADEAASLSLFGGRRHIRVEPAGDEIMEAVEILLAANRAGNPVVIVAGALRKDAKLVRLATAHAEMLACISYPPGERDWATIAAAAAREQGLRVRPDVAQRLAHAAGGDRAILAREIEKFACYLDASPEQPRELEHDALDALGADAEEGDLGRLVDAVLSGHAGRADEEIARLAGAGTEGIPLLRAFLRRFLMLAPLRAEMERGATAQAAVERAGNAIFFKERDTVAAQLGRWDAAAIATAIQRLGAAERAVKASRGAGPIVVDAELLAIGRQAARRR